MPSAGPTVNRDYSSIVSTFLGKVSKTSNSLQRDALASRMDKKVKEKALLKSLRCLHQEPLLRLLEERVEKPLLLRKRRRRPLLEREQRTLQMLMMRLPSARQKPPR